MRFKKIKKNKLGSYLTRGLIIIIFSIVCSILIIKYFSRQTNEILIPLAEAKLRKIVSVIINESTKDIELNRDLFTLVKDNDDEIKMVNYNTYEATKLLNEITFYIDERLENLENINNEDKLNRYVIEEIPFGSIFHDNFLRGLGPKIKIRASILGSVISKLETEVKPYGINNAYVESRVYLEVRAIVYLPFITKELIISNVIPISMNIVQGNVPSGYITSFK